MAEPKHVTLYEASGGSITFRESLSESVTDWSPIIQLLLNIAHAGDYVRISRLGTFTISQTLRMPSGVNFGVE